MRRVVALMSLLAVGLPAAQALACEGSQVVLEDNFTDNLTQWYTDDTGDVKIANGKYVIRLHSDDSATSLGSLRTMPSTFSYKEGDFCVNVGIIPDTGKVSAGLLFWGTDADNFTLLDITAQKVVEVWRKTAGNWNQIGKGVEMPDLKLGTEGSNTLRATVKDNVVTVYVNGKQITQFRGQPPAATWKAGIYADVEKKGDKGVVEFSKFKATSVP